MSETFCRGPHEDPRKADRGDLCWGHVKQLRRKGRLSALRPPQGGVVGPMYRSIWERIHESVTVLVGIDPISDPGGWRKAQTRVFKAFYPLLAERNRSRKRAK